MFESRVIHVGNVFEEILKYLMKHLTKLKLNAKKIISSFKVCFSQKRLKHIVVQPTTSSCHR